MKFLPFIIIRTPIAPTNNMLSDIAFNEALYISSPSLHNEQNKQLVNTNIAEKEKYKLNCSIYKFKQRASNRCTPYGLFAGLSVGKWGEENSVVFDSDLSKSLGRKTSLDMNVVCQIAQEITNINCVKYSLRYYTNESIYKIGDSYRYIEYFYHNSRKIHKLSKVEVNEYLEKVLSKSKSGLLFEEITDLIVSEDISKDEATEFINELISCQLLVNELQPNVIGEDYITRLVKKLDTILKVSYDKELQNYLSILIQVNSLLDELDVNKINFIHKYKDIHNLTLKLIPSVNEINLFQADLYKNTIKCTINKSIQKSIEDLMFVLNRITPIRPNSLLENFKNKFRERYEEMEVPLLHALDSESGVGYPVKDINGINDLVDDLTIESNNSQKDIQWNDHATFLHNIITKSIQNKQKVIQITEDDLKDIDYQNDNWPDTMSIMFKLVDANKNKIKLINSGGSSAVNILGRFTGSNNEIYEIAKKITEYESNVLQGKIIAEISHLPESRVGNILTRPSFRDYEIPYLSMSLKSTEHCINVSDLLISIRNNKVFLRSKKHNKEVIPRLGNAHNYSVDSLPVYHFLSDLQVQYYDKAYTVFNYSIFEGLYNYLPRLEYKNVILSSGRWYIRRMSYEKLLNKNITITEKVILFTEFVKEFDLPNKFLIIDNDNELLIDTKDELGILTFVDEVRKKNNIILEEYLFEETESLVKDTNGNSFTNECIAFITPDKKNTRQPSEMEPLRKVTSKRYFSLGSEWVYCKVYCGVKTADFILTNYIAELMNRFLLDDFIDQWFFIRYADPEAHIRIRFRIKGSNYLNSTLTLFNELFEPLLKEGIVFKLQFDTYIREIERYGDDMIDLAEGLFYNDSSFVIDLLKCLDPESGGKLRWQMAIKSTDKLLDDFGLIFEEKMKFYEEMRNAYFTEHGGSKETKIKLDDKFRVIRKDIDFIFENSSENVQELTPLFELLDRRSNANAAIVNELLKRANDISKSVRINLLRSYIHMNLNRLFMGKNRLNEYVVYDMLSRYCIGVNAKLKKRNSCV